MSEKLELLKKQALLDEGAYYFFRDHPEVAPLQANISILASEIQVKNLPLNEPKSWEAAYEVVKNQLAKPTELIEKEPEPEKWPYPFPEIHSVSDIKRMDSKVYRDFWYDKKNGQLTEKAKTFRAVVQSIIDAENARRAL